MSEKIRLSPRINLAFDTNVFWRIVTWCCGKGASEFTFGVYSINDSELVRKRFAQLSVMLSEYELPPAKRMKTVYFIWEEDVSTPLWTLTEGYCSGGQRNSANKEHLGVIKS